MRNIGLVFLLLLFSSLLPAAPNTSFFEQELLQSAPPSISASFEDVPLNKVLRSLQKEFGYSFAYDGKALKSFLISAVFESASITEVLDELCYPRGLNYEDVEGTFVIFRQERTITQSRTSPTRTNFTFEGRILDANSLEPLPFANVREKGEQMGASSNVEGYFQLFNVSSDTAQIVISYIGYQTKNYRFKAGDENGPIQILLNRDEGLLPEVTVLSDLGEVMSRGELPGVYSLNMSVMEVLPNIGENDVVRSFQLLPGISATTESSAEFHVRGGASDENLLLLDGFTLYHVDHFYGLFSGFNSNSIKNARIHKGVLSAEYGGRGSAVLELTAKNGNLLRPNTRVDLSLMSVSALIESPILDQQASMMLSFRRSFSDVVFSPLYQSLFNNVYERSIQSSDRSSVDPFNETPPSFYFYDLHFKVGFETSQRDRFALSFFSGQDQLDLSYEDLSSDSRLRVQYNDLSEWGNLGVSGKWSRQWRPDHFTNATLGYSSYQSALFGFDVQDNRFIGFVDTVFFDRNTRLDDATFRLDHTWNQEHHELKAGFHLTNYSIDNQSLNEGISGVGQEGSAQLFSLYGQDTWKKNEHFEVLGGWRLNAYSRRQGMSINPRLLVKWMPKKNWEWRAGLGVNEQFIRRVQRQNLLLNTADQWTLASGDEGVPSLRSRQITGGFSWSKAAWKLELDGFWVMKEGVVEDVQLLNGLTPPLSNQDYLFGEGMVLGGELLLKRERGRHNAWLAYTLSYNQNDFQLPADDFIPARFLETHELKAVYLFRSGPWKASAIWVYGSGIPTTNYLGNYDVNLLPNQTSNWPGFGAVLGDRLPAYHRLDLSVDYAFSLRGANVFAGLSCFNVYDRLNVRDQQFYVSGLTQDGLSVELSQLAYLGFTPSIQISVQW